MPDVYAKKLANPFPNTDVLTLDRIYGIFYVTDRLSCWFITERCGLLLGCVASVSGSALYQFEAVAGMTFCF